MNKFLKPATVGLFLVMAGILVLSPPVWAAEAQPAWRATYDLVFRWINFIILVVLLVKLLKNPVKQFLAGSKEKLGTEIKRVEARKAEAEEKIRAAQNMLAESDQRLKHIKARILEQGEAAKAAIIEDARQQSRQMLADAKRRIAGQISNTRDAFRAELVDTAMDIALEKLPQLVGAKDDQRLLKEFLVSIEK